MKDIQRMHATSTRRRFLTLCATTTLGMAAAGTAFAAIDPTVARVQTFYDTLLGAMKQGPQLGIQGRFDMLLPAVHAAYDMPAMMKIACGSKWAEIPADKQQALVGAFERMSAAIYADRFTKFSGQKFVVDPTPVPHNADVVVRTQLVPADGDPVQLNYLMRGPATDMRVVDVFLEGAISELATRRSEFSSVLRSDGPDALLAKLNERTDNILKGK
jgi:phospholipid transport system substrate-binding protein